MLCHSMMHYRYFGACHIKRAYQAFIRSVEILINKVTEERMPSSEMGKNCLLIMSSMTTLVNLKCMEKTLPHQEISGKGSKANTNIRR
ncbi:hypothetical protein E2C01_003759 [Portunus trituberculatus]|uniref:Uncharacterized protein n=1 Tax=Portunus trituberculatus TaxID=210409 RepID=A0A5B7CN77_PORTR|nr:hypothetical protein [Portunus trituberculatus]